METTAKTSASHSRPNLPVYLAWLALAFYLIAIVLVWFNRANEPKPITQRQFETLIQKREVQSLTLLPNRNRVDVTLTKKANQTAYALTILSREFFLRDWEALKVRLPEARTIPFTESYRSTLGSYGLTWTTIGLLALLTWAIWAFILVDIVRYSTSTPLVKLGWLLFVLLAPVIGSLAYLFLARRRRVRRAFE